MTYSCGYLFGEDQRCGQIGSGYEVRPRRSGVSICQIGSVSVKTWAAWDVFLLRHYHPGGWVDKMNQSAERSAFTGRGSTRGPDNPGPRVVATLPGQTARRR